MKEGRHEQYYGIEKGYNSALTQVFHACGTGNTLAAALMSESRPRVGHDSKEIVNRYLEDLTTGFQLAVRTDHIQDKQVMRDMMHDTVPMAQADRADSSMSGHEARKFFDEELSGLWGENTEDEDEKMPEEFAIPSKTDRHFTVNFGHFIATADYLRSLPIEQQPYYGNTLVDQSFIGNWKVDPTPENIWRKIVRVKYVTRELLNGGDIGTEMEYIDEIRVDNPRPNQVITSPLTVQGAARGSWYFEATFPVTLVDENKTEIARGFATATGEWMTEEFVPFTAELMFSAPATQKGYLLIQNANPSGLPENEKTLTIPVNFR